MSDEVLNLIGIIFLVIFAIAFAYLYCKNIYKLYLDINSEKYSVMTVARGVGIVFPFLGAVLGFV